MLLLRRNYMMQEALQYYLLRNRNLPLPGLGCIMIERVPAQGDFVNRQMLPPSFRYKFDKYFDAPDKDFFAYLTKATGMADFEAIKWYNEWAYSVRNDLRNNQPVHLNGVGTLQRDESGEIGFLPASGLDSFLQPTRAQRVVQTNAAHRVRMGDRDLSKQQALNEIEESRSVNDNNWIWWAAGIAVVALSYIIYHFIQNGLGADSVGNLRSLKDWY